MLFLSLATHIVITVVAIVAVQYAFATFCLLKLAYLDISKREYTLWNLFILLVFFIGGTAFLIYYHKVKDKKRIPPLSEVQSTDNAQTATEDNGADGESGKNGKTADVASSENATATATENNNADGAEVNDGKTDNAETSIQGEGTQKDTDGNA